MAGSILRECSPERWLECEIGSYRNNGNPWTEIYTEEVTQKIAKTVALEEADSVQELRLQLAATAEYLVSRLNFTGSPATSSQKHKWSRDVDALWHRLREMLGEAPKYASTLVALNEDKSALRITQSSVMLEKVEAAETAVSHLQDLLRAVEKQPNETGESTSHAQLLQRVVDGMTEVFIDFVGPKHVSRQVSGRHVDGAFPEFVRAAAWPFLKVYYPKLVTSNRETPKLNRQIQQAVKNYKMPL